MLADHIVIMCKGRLVCQGSSTSLKSQYGDSYRIRIDDHEDVAFEAATSTQATKKVRELEQTGDGRACHITFPTLEQVFLKTTSEYGTAIDDNGGDGIVGERIAADDSDMAIEDKILALESEFTGQDLNLDVRRSVGLFRQIWVLFRKRYQLLRQWSGLTIYAVNLFIPILVAAALTGPMAQWQALETCEETYAGYTNTDGTGFAPLNSNSFVMPPGDTAAILGPQKQFSGRVQDALYVNTLYVRYSSTAIQC